MNFRINAQFVTLAILLSTSSLMGDDTKPTATPAVPAATVPEISPFLLPSVEVKYASESTKADAITAKAEAEAAKLRKLAAEVRIKAYKDKLAEITKTGDFDKAQQVKARITQLENEPEGESHKPSKRPRPKDTVKFGGHVYALIKEPATWHVAKQRCEEMGGHLATLETEKEIAFAADLAKKSGLNVWIGITKEEGSWKWVTGDSAHIPGVAIDNANDIEHHIHWSAGINNWNDGPAGWKYPCICEWDR